MGGENTSSIPKARQTATEDEGRKLQGDFLTATGTLEGCGVPGRVKQRLDGLKDLWRLLLGRGLHHWVTAEALWL